MTPHAHDSPRGATAPLSHSDEASRGDRTHQARQITDPLDAPRSKRDAVSCPLRCCCRLAAVEASVVPHGARAARASQGSRAPWRRYGAGRRCGEGDPGSLWRLRVALSRPSGPGESPLPFARALPASLYSSHAAAPMPLVLLFPTPCVGTRSVPPPSAFPRHR